MSVLTADDDLKGGGAASSLGVLGVLKEGTGNHGSSGGSHSVVVQLKHPESSVAGDELEPASKRVTTPPPVSLRFARPTRQIT